MSSLDFFNSFRKSITSGTCSFVKMSFSFYWGILIIFKLIYNEPNQTLGVGKMPDMIRIILFILVAISAIFSLIKEFKKTEKKVFWILIECLILFWMIWLISSILI